MAFLPTETQLELLEYMKGRLEGRWGESVDYMEREGNWLIANGLDPLVNKKPAKEISQVVKKIDLLIKCNKDYEKIKDLLGRIQENRNGVKAKKEELGAASQVKTFFSQNQAASIEKSLIKRQKQLAASESELKLYRQQLIQLHKAHMPRVPLTKAYLQQTHYDLSLQTKYGQTRKAVIHQAQADQEMKAAVIKTLLCFAVLSGAIAGNTAAFLWLPTAAATVFLFMGFPPILIASILLLSVLAFTPLVNENLCYKKTDPKFQELVQAEAQAIERTFNEWYNLDDMIAQTLFEIEKLVYLEGGEALPDQKELTEAYLPSAPLAPSAPEEEAAPPSYFDLYPPTNPVTI